MNAGSPVRGALALAASLWCQSLLVEATKPAPFHETWEEEVPVMGHLAVAMDGTVLIFKEERERKRVEVKRSEDGGRNWSKPVVVGERIRIDADMSDDGRYRGEHVGWSELGNVCVDETTGDIMVFPMGLMATQVLYRSRDHGRTWRTEKTRIAADGQGWLATTYCCDPGITLRHGRHKGRLVMPSQVFVGSIAGDGSRTYLNKGQGRRYFAKRYSNALFSDDGGRTWAASARFPILGGQSRGCLSERMAASTTTHVPMSGPGTSWWVTVSTAERPGWRGVRMMSFLMVRPMNTAARERSLACVRRGVMSFSSVLRAAGTSGTISRCGSVLMAARAGR